MLSRTIREFWHDERGAVGVEWAFIASILVLGSVAGLLAIRAGWLEVNPPAQMAPAIDDAR